MKKNDRLPGIPPELRDREKWWEESLIESLGELPLIRSATIQSRSRLVLSHPWRKKHAKDGAPASMGRSRVDPALGADEQ